MDTIATRIIAVVETLGKSKSDFARCINVTPAYISKLGKQPQSIPSDRTISDICREFGVDEIWLRTGIGEMFREQSRDEELAALMGQLMNERPESFRRRLLSVLLRFDPAGPEWQVLEDIFEALKKEAQD